MRLNRYGLIHGYSETHYGPADASARAENAAVTARMIRVIMQSLIEAERLSVRPT